MDDYLGKWEVRERCGVECDWGNVRVLPFIGYRSGELMVKSILNSLSLSPSFAHWQHAKLILLCLCLLPEKLWLASGQRVEGRYRSEITLRLSLGNLGYGSNRGISGWKEVDHLQWNTTHKSLLVIHVVCMAWLLVLAVDFNVNICIRWETIQPTAWFLSKINYKVISWTFCMVFEQN